MSRDKASLDIFWLKNESLETSDNLPDPDVIADIDSSEFRVPPIQAFESRLRSECEVRNAGCGFRFTRAKVLKLEAALEQFREIVADLGMGHGGSANE